MQAKPASAIHAYHPFVAGRDIGGDKLYLCRTWQHGQMVPGKYSKSIDKCSISDRSKEVQRKFFELLLEGPDFHYKWVQLKKPVKELPDNVVLGGSQNPTSMEMKLKMIDSILNNNFHHFGNRKRRVRRFTQNDWEQNSSKPVTERFDQEPSTKLNGCTNSVLVSSQCKDEQKGNYYIARCSLRTDHSTSEQIGKVWWKQSIQEWVASFSFGGHEVFCMDYSVLTIVPQ